jgi:hypothetical protein
MKVLGFGRGTTIWDTAIGGVAASLVELTSRFGAWISSRCGWAFNGRGSGGTNTFGGGLGDGASTASMFGVETSVETGAGLDGCQISWLPGAAAGGCTTIDSAWLCTLP